MGILVFNVIIHIKWQPTSKEIWQMQSKMLNVNDTLVTLYANVGYNVVILVSKIWASLTDEWAENRTYN